MHLTNAQRGAILYPVLFLTAFVVIFAAMDRGASVYDEGLILTGAMRVSSGEIPHQDFYANYGPAQFYVVALLFKLFGPLVMAERFWDFAIKAGIATLGFVAVRAYCGPAAAFVAYITCTIWLATFGTPGFPLFPAILFSLAATLLVASSRGQDLHRTRIVAAGLCVGLTALFRYEVGGLVFAVLMAMLIVAAISHGERFWRIPSSPPWLFALGFVAIFGPAAFAYLLAGGSIGAVTHDVVFISTNYGQMRRLPLPLPGALWNAPVESAVYLPPAVIGVALALIASRRDIAPLRWVMSAFAALCFVFFLKGWVRISAIHMSGAIIIALILLPMLWKRTDGAPTGKTFVLMCAALAAVPTLYALKAVIMTAKSNVTLVGNFLLRGAASCDARRNLRPIACIDIDERWAAAVQFVIEHVPKDERLFAGTARHDKLIVNDNLIYFATQRFPATHWHHYDPGLQTRADIQNKMVAELEQQAVRYVVLNAAWDNIMEQNASALSSGVTILDDYIRLHYETVEQYGTISVLARRKPP